jgi:uncharacterized membrane protein HdeD (DUF308 family)
MLPENNKKLGYVLMVVGIILIIIYFILMFTIKLSDNTLVFDTKIKDFAFIALPFLITGVFTFVTSYFINNKV